MTTTGYLLSFGSFALVTCLCLYRKQVKKNAKQKETFYLFKADFNPLLADLASNKFNKEAWAVKIVNTKSPVLQQWWMSFITKTQKCTASESIQLMKEMLYDWGIDCAACKDLRSAKVAFVEELPVFLPMLVKISKHEFEPKEWSDAIVNLYNIALVDLWKSLCESSAGDVNKLLLDWKTELNVWGICFDTCSSFTFRKGRYTAYDTMDKSLMEEGVKYRVLQPCCMMTKEDEDGGISREILIRGIVERA